MEFQGVKKPNAIKKGNFLEHFGIDVECYVLDDESKTAVISKTGMPTALGFANTGSGTALFRFIDGKIISKYIGLELRQKLENPLIFKGSLVGLGGNDGHGYDVTILIDICRAILAAHADKKLDARYDNVVKQAQIITTASAKAGIKGLVYALAGYDATREEIIQTWKRYVIEEAQEYEREFPHQLYVEWCRLYKVEMPKRNRPWLCLNLTRKHVYEPLCNSNGEILKLLREAKEKGGKKTTKLFQYLEVIGRTALRQHLGQLLGIARISKSQAEYEKHFDELFGKDVQITLDDFVSNEIIVMGAREITQFDKNIMLALNYNHKEES